MKINKNFILFFLVISILVCDFLIFAYCALHPNEIVTEKITDYLKVKTQRLSMYFDKKSDNPKKFDIALSDKEKFFIIENMKQSKNYLEFGAGGSTFLALINSDANIVSVESDQMWINHMKEWDIINKYDGNRVHFYCVNIGPVGDWGYPIEPVKYKESFPNYSAQVFRKFDSKFDLIFIDGRFRVACALQAILNTDDNVKIIMHDFTVRPYYNPVLEFLDVEKTVDTMVLFKKKKNINQNRVKQLYEKYKYIAN